MKIDNDLILTIDDLYRPTIQHQDVPHPKLMVLFSGSPSSGKSTVARAIEKRFQAIRLENDSVRAIAAKRFPDTDLDWKSELSYGYMGYLMDQLGSTPVNGLWVIDANIDVHYKRLFSFAKKYQFDVIIFAMTVPEDLRRKWIISTGDRPWATTDKYLETMAMRKKQHDQFLSKHTADMYITPDYKIDDIFELIDARLKDIA